MNEKQFQARNAELEEKLRLLTLENDHLADRAEETLLLGLIAEKINTIDDVDDLINMGLEQIALLKDIPYVACFAFDEGQAWNLHGYTLAEAIKVGDQPVPMAAELVEALENGGCTLQGEEQQQFPCFEGSDCGFQALMTILLPLRNRFGNQMLFLFATDREAERLGSMNFLLPRVVEMIDIRLDNLALLNQLTMMNEGLDQMVNERTKELKASESRIRTLFEGAYDAFFVIDEKMEFRDVNEEACKGLGYTRDELIGTKVPEIVEGTGHEELKQTAALSVGGEFQIFESVHRRKDGTTFPVEIRLGPIEIDGQCMLLAQARDISERNLLLEQLNQAQKMEAVGRLAGGIAHDFNNILTAIIGHVDLLQVDLPADDPARESLGLINESSKKAARLTHQLLAFSRKQVMDMGSFDLPRNILAMSSMLQRMISENIDLEMELDRAAGHIFGDPGRVEQILMNLVINARDAMPDGGHLKVITQRIPVEDGFPDPIPEGPAATGQYVMVQVVDTGHGIPAEILNNIFDPFFTTKEVGKGTGLGLAMVYGLAKQHHALVRARSKVGVGSTFEVIFPEVEEMGSDSAEPQAKAIPRGKENVLLVEDDPGIGEVLSRMIGRLGYNLLFGNNGQEALQVVADFNGPLDLVLTDVIMPKMGGGELVRLLKYHYPDIKVIYMSGYTDDTIGHEELAAPNTRFVQKPVSFIQLAEELRLALDKRPGKGRERIE